MHKANDLLQLASDGHNITLLFLKLYEEKDVSLNYLALWILQCVVFTIFIEV